DQPKPKTIYHQFGATFGGPIKRDKLFYFGAYEGTTDRRFAEVFATVPTEAMRNGDMSASPDLIYDPATGNANGSGKVPFLGNIIPRSRIDPSAAKLAALTPLPNISRGSELFDNLYATGAYKFNRHKIDSKVNWNVSNKLNMFARFGYLKYNGLSDGIMGKELGGFAIFRPATVPSPLFGSTYSSTLAGSYVFWPNFIVDAYFGYTLIDTNQAHLRINEKLGLDFLGIPGTNGARSFEGGWPSILFDFFDGLGNPNATRPLLWHDPRSEYVANANWMKGSHNLRFGFYSSRQHLNHVNPNFPGLNFTAAGGFFFSGGATTINDGVRSPNQYNNYADFLLGLPSSMGKTLQVP
ncbi:MAG: hypothetical protein ACREBC_37445, partial [Pyrinomonadaceae bacterium]